MQRVRTDCDITATILASGACISPPPHYGHAPYSMFW